MLHFHGIEIDKGIPKKFSKTYELRESLHRYIQYSIEFNHNHDRLIKWIEHKINQVYETCQQNQNLTAQQRKEIALFSRTKDICKFNILFKDQAQLTQSVCEKLSEVLTIKKKWESIKKLITTEYVIEDKQRIIDLLTNKNTYLYQLVSFIQLIFLDQIEEKPPANLILNFIPAKFPQHEWVTTDTHKIKKIMRWETQEKLCQFDILIYELIQSYNQVEDRIAFFDQTQVPQIFQNKGLNKKLVSTTVHFFNDSTEELPMLIEFSPLENLLMFQDEIKKEFKNRGVLHFLALLTQITALTKNQICYFSFQKHLELVAQKNKKGIYSSKEINLAKAVLNKIEQLYIVRIWECEEKRKFEEKGFMLTRLKEKIAHKTNLQALNLPEVIYLVDDFFVPNKHQIHFGHALQLIPEDVFKINVKESPLIPFLSSYFSLHWLLEFKERQGILEKSGQEIIQNCGLKIAPSDKYRIIYKLESTLKLMEQKSFIHTFHIEKSQEKNPWLVIYKIQANNTTIKQIENMQSKMELISA